MGMDKERTNCIGGWSFLCLAVGIFMLLPGSILTGIYANKDETMRTVALAMFGCALSLLIIGCILCVVWCRSSPANEREKLAEEGSANGKKDKKSKKDENNENDKSPPSNGQVKNQGKGKKEAKGEKTVKFASKS